MKKYLAKLFRTWANKLAPLPEIKTAFPSYLRLDMFDIKELAIGFVIDEREIREAYEYIALRHGGMADSETMDKLCIDKAKKRIKDGIFLAIEQHNLIDFRVDEFNNPFSIQVTGKLKVGIKK